MPVWLDYLFPDHPKVVAAGGDAAWLYVCGLCYCGRHLTDGRIPKPAVPRLSDRRSPGRLAARLVAAGLWHDEGDHYRVHDWEEHNMAAEAIRAQRGERATARSEAARKAARARWGAPPGASDPHMRTHPQRMPNAPPDAPKPHDERNADAMPPDAPHPNPHPWGTHGVSHTPQNLGVVGPTTLESALASIGRPPGDEPATGGVGYANGVRSTDVVRRLVSVCTAEKRSLVESEAVDVVAHLAPHVDLRIVDEAIGAYLGGEKRPTLPRALVPAVARRVDFPLPPFTPRRRP